MSSLSELYYSISEKLKSISSRYKSAEQQLTTVDEYNAAAVAKRIDQLKEQLVLIEDYSGQVEYFRRLGEKHIISRNLLTIMPHPLNFHRMKQWATMIDPTEPDDPYAQRIYVQAQCNAMYLTQKREEFTAEIEELTNSRDKRDDSALIAVNRLKTELVGECRAILESSDCEELAEGLTKQHKRYSDAAGLQERYSFETSDNIGLGVYALSFPVLSELRSLAKGKFGEYYVKETNSLLWPTELSPQKENIISVTCTASRSRNLYDGIQNYLLNMLSALPVESEKIYVLDALHYNNTILGELRAIENTIAIEPIPKDAEELLDTLKLIVSSFPDLDETLGVSDSVCAYNEGLPPDQTIQRTLLVLVGYPSAFSADAKELVKRILLNNERYGISVFLTDTQVTDSERKSSLPVDVADGLTRIEMGRQKITISQSADTEYHFRWYSLTSPLTPDFIEKVKSLTVRKARLGTEYIRRIDIEKTPPYTRGKKSIVLPYGIDAKDQIQSVSFDNENFAMYLMGASGSGKSTLLHTLITGVLRDYHPDDVELWLADFKMSEFAQYIDPLPPHIKYILLDESQELVYDLIDKLTDEMMKRQRFFMKNRDLKKVENVPSSIHMPVIFVILDEFSIMSQSIAESDAYRLKLQNLLAKGRALGIKFLFSSQTFLSGIRGLTVTAKAQIQSRIAMKNSKEEITETLELSAAQKTDQVKSWIDALPPHIALYKYRDGDAVNVTRLQVMYFAGKGDEAYAPQRNLIKRLNGTYRAVPEASYSPDNLYDYVDKHPVIVDGNSYAAFDHAMLDREFAEYRRANEKDLAATDTLIAFGVPRRMVNLQLAVMSSESRENIALISNMGEQACSAAVIMSALECFKMQGRNVEIWAYGRSRMYRAYKETLWSRYTVVEGIDDICDAIRALKKAIINKEAAEKLIVLIGIERICLDFDFVDGNEAAVSQPKKSIALVRQAFVANGATVTSDEDERRVQFGQKWAQYKVPFVLQAKAAGKSEEEIKQMSQELWNKFMAEQGLDAPAAAQPAAQNTAAESAPAANPEEKQEEIPASGAYNAKEDFSYVVMQGSRLGYHFLLNLSDFADLKTCGLKPEVFRYKLGFQMSVDDSRTVFGTKIASQLPEHICQYDDSLDRYSFRPYLHKGVSWEGWYVDDDGKAVSSFDT